MCNRVRLLANAVKSVMRKGGAIMALCAVGFAGPAAATNSWPERPVTIIVPFSAGGATDIVARLIGASLSEQWAQSVVVENRTGAGGNIGTGLVASAKPDGYTILMASGANLTINPHLYDNLSFDVSNDFAPITNVATGPMVVAVSETITAPTLADFIKDASANPAHYTIGSAGVGSQGHLAGENFQVAAGIDLVHVPYRGESAAFADLMAGQIDVVVGNIGAALAPLNSGRIRLLAVASEEPTELLPDVPIARESGATDYVNYGWFGFVAPAGTDPQIVDKVYSDVKRVLEDEEVIRQLAELGMLALGNTPAEFNQQIEQESAQWAQIIAERNISID